MCVHCITVCGITAGEQPYVCSQVRFWWSTMVLALTVGVDKFITMKLQEEAA